MDYAVDYSALPALRLHPKPKTPWLALGFLAAILVPLAIAVATLMDRADERTSRVRCARNLRGIGAAVALQVREKGAYPVSLADLLGDMGPESFICSRSQDSAATGSGPQIAEALRAGRNSSYVYVGQGMTRSTPPAAILAYEKPGHHRGEGLHVLQVDGTVVWVDQQAGERIIGEVRAGFNPPRPSPTR